MKAHIIPIVLHIDDSTYNQVAYEIEMEIAKYDVVNVSKKRVSMVPVCFDTESTTVEDPETGLSHAALYHYQLQVGRITVLARKRDLILKLFKEMHYIADQYSCIIYCGIANIKYEWSFMRQDFMHLFDNDPDTSTNVSILLDTCQPLAVNMGNVILVDICNMTNSSLAKIGEDYCTTQKLKGDLDYSELRNSMTPLTKAEEQYCINDVVVGAEFMEYIHDRFTKKGKKLPTTATSIPRSIMSAEAYRVENKKRVYKKELYQVFSGHPGDYSTYAYIMDYLFRGGYTHGNIYYTGETLLDIEHVDYTSDYPACLLQHKYPTVFTRDDSNYKTLNYRGKRIDPKKYCSEDGLKKLLKFEGDIAFYCTAVFKNIKHTTEHSIESEHKCIRVSDDATKDNGRIREASELEVMITEQDFQTYLKFYKWDEMLVSDLHVAIKEPLPKYVIKAIVNSYVMKKWLKDHGLSYVAEKAILNSCYGCCVQRFNIEDKWEVYTDDEVKTITCPFPHRYLDLNDEHNLPIYNQILSVINTKYGYTIDQKLKNNLKIVYDKFEEGKWLYESKYMNNLASVVIDVCQDAAYQAELRGSHERTKMLSCWWGIWCTAYARRRLTDMISTLETWANENEYEPIVVYCDTDSMFLNCHQDEECNDFVTKTIKAYNDNTVAYNKTNLTQYTQYVTDDDVDNKDELLSDIGVFDSEPTASHFKQLGAKRYLQRYIPKKKTEYIIESTVAGLNKDDFSRRVNSIEGSIEEKFDFFTDEMTFEPHETSKLRPVYYNSPYEVTVTDKYGNTEVMRENCGQVLLPVGFEMTLCGLIKEYLSKRIG